MDASSVPKRAFDSSTVDRPEPPLPTAPGGSTKRRYNHHPPSSSSGPPTSVTFRPHPSSLKLSAGETLFRVLCPATKTGGVIGKGGTIIRQVRDETGARIRIDDSVPGCEERVILIIADATRKGGPSAIEAKNNSEIVDATGEESANSSSNWSTEDEGSPAQLALVRVFERILKVDEERSGILLESEKAEEKKEGGGNIAAGAAPHGQVACRLLAPSNQVGCVLGRGGKIVEKIRHDSGAQVRVLPRDQIPACASPGDELIQMTGNFLAVRRALLSVSSCLQDNARADAVNSGTPRSSGMAHHATGTENIGTNHRMVMEEEIVFKLLCQVEKVGSLIGKGGSIVRALQNETGASIKIIDAAPDSDEKVVIISARENSEQRHSPAQDAVIRVHCRIAEIGFEPGAAVVARLLVHPQQIGCLLGKGGIIIAELRRATGASIRIFPKEQAPKYGSQNDEVVQIIGSLQSVQDALFQITSRLRETIFPAKAHFPTASGPPFLPPYSEMPPGPPPLFRPRHDPTSPGHYPSPVGLPRGADRAAIPIQPHDPQAFSHGMDHVGPTYFDHIPYPYKSERPAHGPPLIGNHLLEGGYLRQWLQAIKGGVGDSGGGITMNDGPTVSGNQVPNTDIANVEVVIPQMLLIHVYGENNGNLSQIRQVSGAKVVVHDPRPGATEGVVVISGMREQIHVAQSLIHAFILCELPFEVRLHGLV